MGMTVGTLMEPDFPERVLTIEDPNSGQVCVIGEYGSSVASKL